MHSEACKQHSVQAHQALVPSIPGHLPLIGQGGGGTRGGDPEGNQPSIPSIDVCAFADVVQSFLLDVQKTRDTLASEVLSFTGRKVWHCFSVFLGPGPCRGAVTRLSFVFLTTVLWLRS